MRIDYIINKLISDVTYAALKYDKYNLKNKGK